MVQLLSSGNRELSDGAGGAEKDGRESSYVRALTLAIKVYKWWWSHRCFEGSKQLPPVVQVVSVMLKS